LSEVVSVQIVLKVLSSQALTRFNLNLSITSSGTVNTIVFVIGNLFIGDARRKTQKEKTKKKEWMILAAE
jgi:hypothetical protein